MSRPHGYSAVPESNTHENSSNAQRRVSIEEGLEIEDDVVSLHLDSDFPQPTPVRAFLVRALALLCACFLSVGSH